MIYVLVFLIAYFLIYFDNMVRGVIFKDCLSMVKVISRVFFLRIVLVVYKEQNIIKEDNFVFN